MSMNNIALGGSTTTAGIAVRAGLASSAARVGPTSANTGGFHAGPICLVSIDDSGQCQIGEDAIKVLNMIPSGRVAIVCVSGFARTGKSFLMNRLVGKNGGGGFGSTDISQKASSVWIWGQPVELGNNTFAIIMDTEGLGDENRRNRGGKNIDTQIVSIALLLSSIFVYNSVGPFGTETVGNLDVVAQIQGILNGSSSPSSPIIITPPSLLCVLRDFDNSPVNAQSYMEECLLSGAAGGVTGLGGTRGGGTRAGGTGAGGTGAGGVGGKIQSEFQNRDCLILPSPVDISVTDARLINTMPFEKLRPEFRSGMDKFIESVYTRIEPKRFGNQLLTGSLMVQLVQQFCYHLNLSSGQLSPTITADTWAAVVQTQLKLAMKDAIGIYRSVLSTDGMEKLPLSDSEIRSVHLKAKAVAKEYIPDQLLLELNAVGGLVGGASGTSPDETLGGLNQSLTMADVGTPDLFRREYRMRRKQLLNHLKNENSKAAICRLEKIWIQTVKEVIDPVLANGIGPLLSGWKNAITEFHKKCESKFPIDAYNQFVIESLIPSMIGLTSTAVPASAGAAGGTGLISGSRSSVPPPTMPEEERNRWKERVIQLETALNEQKAAAMAAVRVSPQIGNPDMTEFLRIREMLTTALSELKTAEVDKRQVQLKADSDQNMILLERRFNKQLNETRRKNELLIDNLKVNYENEINQLKTQRNQMEGVIRNMEIECLRKQSEIERLTLSQNAANRFNSIAQRQAEVVVDFIKNNGSLSKNELRDLENFASGKNFASYR